MKIRWLFLALLLGLLTVNSVEAIPSVLDSFPSPGASGTYNGPTVAGDAMGQSFTVTGGQSSFLSASFWLLKLGSPTGNAKASLFQLASSSLSALPVGSPIAQSDLFDISRPGSTGSRFDFSFSGQYVISDGVYAIAFVLETDAVVDGSNYVALQNAQGADATDPGSSYTRTSGTWEIYATNRDFYYSVSGESSSTSGGTTTPTTTPTTEPTTTTEPAPSIPSLPANAWLIILGVIAVYLFARKGKRK